MQIRFWVEGVPKPQPRPKAFVRRGCKGDGKPRAGVYDPGSSDEWKRCVRECAEPHRPDRPFDGPVAVDIYWFLKRPKRLMRQRDPAGPIAHSGHPDRDNLDKSTLDALDDAGWFSDDSRVCAGHIVKCYAPMGRGPGAVIVIRDASPDVLAARDALMEVSDGEA